MTFSEILTAAYDECNYAASPAAAIVTRMKRFVNEGVRVILSEPGLQRLADSDQPISFATTASTARYALAGSISRIRVIADRTNDWTLDVMGLDEYRRLQPDPAEATGTPTHLVPIGRVALAKPPSDSSALFVKSTSASDTQSAYLEEVVTDATNPGEPRNETLTLTGTTAVSSSSGIVDLADFYLSSVAVGTVTIHEDSGSGTELGRIYVGQTRPRYYGFYLYPTPAAAVTYYVDYRREIVDLVNNTDEPPLSLDAHPMLVAFAVMREAEKTGKREQHNQALARYTRMMTNLKYQTQTLSGELPVVGRGRIRGRSRLGGMYPADIYIRG